MTIQELDRLVTKTAMNPASKRALKEVRRAVIKGESHDPAIGRGSWSIEIQTQRGLPVRMRFSLRREKNAD